MNPIALLGLLAAQLLAAGLLLTALVAALAGAPDALVTATGAAGLAVGALVGMIVEQLDTDEGDDLL